MCFGSANILLALLDIKLNRIIIKSKKQASLSGREEDVNLSSNVDYATLSNDTNFTIFKFKDHLIRFKAPYSLERYLDVIEWDHGYLVVTAKYRHNTDAEEEYIDLVPILEDLYFDVDDFLNQIKEVRVQNV